MRKQKYYFIGTGKNLENISHPLPTEKSKRGDFLPKVEVLRYLNRIKNQGKPCIFGFWYDKVEKALVFEKTELRKNIDARKYPHEQYFYRAELTCLYRIKEFNVLTYVRHHSRTGGSFAYNKGFYLIGVHHGVEIRNPYYKG